MSGKTGKQFLITVKSDTHVEVCDKPVQDGSSILPTSTIFGVRGITKDTVVGVADSVLFVNWDVD